MRRAMGRMRLALISVIVAALAAVGGAAAAAPAVIKQRSGPLSATLTLSSRTPKINAPDPITVTATLNGRPARATAVYQFVFNGAVVSTQYPYNNKHYTFTGHFSDKLTFPASSLGFASRSASTDP